MSYNKEEMNEYTNKWRDKRRAYAIGKLGGKCCRCGAMENLHFDHIDKSTKCNSIGSIWTSSKEKFESEIKKCQLLCKECHKDKTSECGDIPKPKIFYGEENGSSKLTEADVRYIRDQHREGVTVASLCRQFNMSRGTIGSIIRYKTWKHVI